MEEFSEEQKQYLGGFMSGIQARMPFLGQTAEGKFTGNPEEAVEENVYGTPVEDLSKEETIKYEQNGLDCLDSMYRDALSKEFAKGGDVFRYKFYGMFHVSPAQDSYMMRARVPGGVLNSLQLRGIAKAASDWGGDYVDLTTRNNFQIREIMPENTVKMIDRLVELGITSRGSGADNVRNVTATPTTGFDKYEFVDVMPYAKAMHHYILNNRDLYGLPRKFNIAYDSGGSISVCADTNDIGFYAVKVEDNQDGLEPGVYFRVQLCGITGHKQFASDCGVLLTLDQAIPFAAALMRVFIEHGDRTNRKKARFKYLVDKWGVQKTLDEINEKLSFDLFYYPEEKCVVSKPKVKQGHVGVYKQNNGLNYVGVVIPVGRMEAEQVEKIADIAEQYGSGEVRLTVWQNLIIPNVPDENVEGLKKAVVAAGFHYTASSVSGGVIACTGNTGCKYAQANTKGQAVELSKILDQKVELDQPINIHLTGCPHSCAQHYIGDIGMQGIKVRTESGESVEGYNIVLGGGVDDDQFIARDVFKAVAFTDIPPLIENLLKAYLANREERETFAQFTRRHEIDDLKNLVKSTA